MQGFGEPATRQASFGSVPQLNLFLQKLFLSHHPDEMSLGYDPKEGGRFHP